MTQHRADRLAEVFKKEISQMIQEEIKDPRIGFVTITAVEVSGDLHQAKVFVSVYGDDKAKVQSLEGLNRASGFIRAELGKRVRLRYTPEIVFKFDDSIEHGSRIMELLSKVKSEGE